MWTHGLWTFQIIAIWLLLSAVVLRNVLSFGGPIFLALGGPVAASLLGAALTIASADCSAAETFLAATSTSCVAVFT